VIGNRKNGPVRGLSATLLATALLLSACSKKEETAAAPEPPKRVSVVTLRPQAVPLTAELPGRVVAFRTAEVRPQVNGVITKRLFEEGTKVRAGQPLYQIDAAPYRAQFKSAEAAATVAQRRADRQSALFKSEVISRQTYDEAEAVRLQAEAALENARINLGYTRIVAPIDGLIGRSNVTEGALVTAGQPAPLVTLMQLDPVYVDTVQPSRVLLQLRREQSAGRLQQNKDGAARVRLRLEDGTQYENEGALQFTELAVDETTGSVTMRSIFPNPKLTLIHGMFVYQRIQEGVREQALLVPQQGVTRDAKGEATALVVTGDNKVERRALVTDRAVADQWLVSAGLSPGDRVIVEGLQFAKPGDTVAPAEYVAPQPPSVASKRAS
jgi:membrane fusion protein (multidrug efflux system)